LNVNSANVKTQRRLVTVSLCAEHRTDVFRVLPDLVCEKMNAGVFAGAIALEFASQILREGTDGFEPFYDGRELTPSHRWQSIATVVAPSVSKPTL
jgi:hypothetical protein